MAETIVHSSPAAAHHDAEALRHPSQNLQRGADDRQPPRLSGRNGYSLFVSSMKLLLPAVAAGLVLLVIAWPQLMPDVSRSGLDFAKIARDHAKTLNMLNARYTGVDDDNQPFTIAADLATQSPDNEDMVELQHPKADMKTNEGNLVGLSARVGHYDRKAETLDLTGKVQLTHDDGFDIVTEQATVSLKDGSAAGDAAVTGQGPSGELQSEGFRLRERGRVIIFTGQSRLLIHQQSGQSSSKQDGTPDDSKAPGDTKAEEGTH